VKLLTRIRSERLSLLLAGWFFFVSIGYTVTLHYCNDRLSGITILGELSTCCNIIDDANAENHSICQSAKEKACDNASYSVDLDTDVIFSQVSLVDFDFQIPQSLRMTHSESLELYTLPHIFANPPPLVNQDYRILYCSYLL
jgi:hypothetical protein